MTLTLASAVAHGEAVTLGYTVPAAQPLRNLAGLGAPGFAGREVANATADVTAPVLHTASVNGAALVLTYDEALDESLRAGPGRVHGDRGRRRRGRLAASDPVAVSGKTVTLTLASAVAHGETVTLGYTVPAAQPLRNLAGLGAPGFAGREVANATPDATAPVLLTSSVDGAALVLTYDEALDEASVPAPGAFTVTVAGAARGLAASDPVAVSGKTVTLTLASAVAHGEAVTLGYTVPAAQPLRNLAGLGAPGFAGREVANATPDATAPVLLTSSVDGAALVLTYDEALDEASVPAPGAFTVTVAGTARSLAASDPVAVSGKTVTLTLASAVSGGGAGFGRGDLADAGLSR